MITNAIINLFFYLLSLLIALIPSSSGFPSDIQTAFTDIFSSASMWNNFLPVYQLLVILGIVFAIEAGIFTFRFIDWIYTKVRGGSHASGAK